MLSFLKKRFFLYLLDFAHFEHYPNQYENGNIFFNVNFVNTIDYCSIQIAMNNAFWNRANSNVCIVKSRLSVYVDFLKSREKKSFPKCDTH